MLKYKIRIRKKKNYKWNFLMKFIIYIINIIIIQLNFYTTALKNNHNLIALYCAITVLWPLKKIWFKKIVIIIFLFFLNLLFSYGTRESIVNIKISVESRTDAERYNDIKRKIGNNNG